MFIFQGGGLELHINPTTFGIEKILLQDDPSRVSFVKGNRFGLPSGNNFLVSRNFDPKYCTAEFMYFSNLAVTMDISEKRERVCITYTFRNTKKTEVVEIHDGDIGIYFPFNDTYDIPSVTLNRRVHSFIRTEGETYIYNARVSGDSDSVSLAMLGGDCYSYRTELNAFSLDRGEISLDLPPTTIDPGESFSLTFYLYRHSGFQDFMQKAYKYRPLDLHTNATVLQQGEKLILQCSTAESVKKGEESLSFEEGKCHISMKEEGEGCLSVFGEDLVRTLRYYVLSSELKDRRVTHLLHKQYLSDGPYKGAFSAYDEKQGTFVLPQGTHKEEKLVESSLMPLLFLLSESRNGREGLTLWIDSALSFCDERLHAVLKRRGKPTWENTLVVSSIALLRYEEYFYRGDIVCLMESAAIVSDLLRRKEGRPITAAARVIASLREEGKDIVANELAADVIDAAARLLEGEKLKIYSPFDICGEVFLLSDAYILSKKEEYLLGAKGRLACLTAFLAPSCDYRTNGMPNFYTKELSYDVSPNRFDVLFALALERYARASGEEEYASSAKHILQTAETIFQEDGSALQGRAIPTAVNDKEPVMDISYGEDVILYLINLLLKA